MEYRTSTVEQIREFSRYLREEERETATIDKYSRDVKDFFIWLKDREISRERMGEWRGYLLKAGRKPVTINGKLSALNKFLSFLGRNDCRIKYLKIQRRLFRSTEKQLSKQEYIRLMETAHSLGRERLALLMETICATGIRVSEVKYITAYGDCSKRKDSHHPASREALPEAEKIRWEKKNRLRRGIPHQKRKRDEPPPDMGGDEVALRKGGGCTFQGLSAQSAAPVCPNLLSGLPGCGKAGGCVGPFQY